MRLNELTELQGIVLEEGGRGLGVLGVERGVDDGAGLAVVQIRAGTEVHRIQPDVFIKILDELGVGPCLIGRVADLTLPPAQEGADDSILGGGLGFLPLLQLHDHGGALAIAADAGEDEVDAFAGLRDIEFDSYAGVVGDIGITKDRIHVAEGIFPRGQFAPSHGCSQRALDRVVHDIRNPVGEDVGAEIGFGGEVDDHGRKFASVQGRGRSAA